MGNHINKPNNKAQPSFGLRLRLMFGLVDFMTNVGALPTMANITRWPMKKRQNMLLPQWLTHPPLPANVTITNEVIPATQGEPLEVRVFTPALVNPSRPAVLYIHGGGWIAGGMRNMDYVCANVAADVGVRVVSVEYRLAPEFPFPAGLEDCYAALSWLSQHHSESGSSTSDVAVMGDSAGGNLAAAVCLLSKQRGGPRIAHQTLIYPCLDANLKSESMQHHRGGLRRDQIADMLAHYLQGNVSPDNPLVSPLKALDLTGLPPAFILTADADPLRDEGKLYAEKLLAAGVSTRYLNVLGTPHGFISLPKLCKQTAGAMTEIVNELRAVKVTGAGTHE